MSLLNSLINDIDMPELNDAHFKDEEQRLYRYFIEKMTNDGLTLPLVFSDKFKQILKLKQNPHLVDAINKALEVYKAQNKNASKTEDVLVDTSFMDKVPLTYFLPESSLALVITKRAQRKMSLRDLIYELFPLYKDDLVSYEILFHGKPLAKGQGELSKCFVNTDILAKIPMSSNVQMFTVKLSLTGRGDSRRRHEDFSSIFNVDEAKKQLVTKETQLELFKRQMEPSLVLERLKLFNINLSQLDKSSDAFVQANMVPSDFDAKEITEIRSVHFRFHQKESNSELLKFKGRFNLELQKMKEWLDRDNADGKNGRY